MQLSRIERWILANQYRILEKLSKDKAEAEGYSVGREALESGYELHYTALADPILEETLSREECKEVKEILFMYQTLQAAHEVFPDVSVIDPYPLAFPGFCTEKETRQWGYARYCFDRLGANLRKTSETLTSAIPMLDRYRNMLREWKKVEVGKHTREDVERIVSVGEGRG